MDASLEAKNKGNAAFAKGDFKEAIQHFTEAIELDPANHVLYSNRSAAHASLRDYEAALSDADETVHLRPDWAKGYSRRGAALFGLGKLGEAADTYRQGLEIEPANPQLQQGLKDIEQAKKPQPAPGGMGDMFSKMFSGDVFSKIRNSPTTAEFLNEPDFVRIIADLQQNPSNLNKYMQDPRILQVLGVLMGIPIETRSAAPPGEPAAQKQPAEPKKAEPKAEPKKPEPKAEPKVQLSPEQQKAEDEKQKGNEAYKNKDFEAAIKHYDAATEADPKNITYMTNKAAALFEMGKYDECIEVCKKAIEEGRKVFADYSLIAKAYARIGNACMKLKQYDNAVEAYGQSLTEHRIPQTLEAFKKAEKAKAEYDREAYIDPQKSIEAKERGNTHFKNGNFPEAIKEYTEAIKRNPSDHTLYSNRAACYTKLTAFPEAIKDCDECIRMKPDFIKGYTRKATVYSLMKDFSKALEVYDEALKHDPENKELQADVANCLAAANQKRYQSQGGPPDKEALERASKDPEIQEILSDPVMRQILEDMQTNPGAAQNHLRNPAVMKRVQKLVDAGVLRLG